MSNVWNDCPLCGKQLFSSNDVRVYCTSMNDHYSVMFLTYAYKEEFHIDYNFCIVRSENRTVLFKRIDNSWCSKFLINKVLDFNKFNTMEKINKLLRLNIIS